MSDQLLEQLSQLGPEPRVRAPFDPQFRPAALVNRAFRHMADEDGAAPLRLALERSDGSVSTYATHVFRAASTHAALNLPYAERLVKFLLWQRGGHRIYVDGPGEIAAYLRAAYAPGGLRAFDADFMARVYERDFEVVAADGDMPPERESSAALGRHLAGNRVGIDLGASRRKATALIDGEVVFSEGVPWAPAHEPDPTYHYTEILKSIRSAAEHLPSLDGVGISAAGVYVNNRVRVGSIFRGMSREVFEQDIAGMFIRMRDELGVPLEVVNDGEVTALAGSMSDGENPVLGTALGSAQAGGYVTRAGNITNWLNELAFVPVDYNAAAPADEWSGDTGCGVVYLSQVGAVRAAQTGGMPIDAALDEPRKFETLQARMEAGDPIASGAYDTIGVYLGYSVAHYADFYDLRSVQVMGGVINGAGGDHILARANEVLTTEFPELAARVRVSLPDPSSRRTGQAIAAASLPELRR